MSHLFTIGYAAYSLESFLAALAENGINAIVDVRAEPERSHFYEYRRDNIRASLVNSGFAYRFFEDALGARPKDRSLYSNGKADFSKIMNYTPFREICANIKTGLDKNIRICLMCAQKDPIICHRSILVTHYMRLQYPQIPIVHLHPVRPETQEELDRRVLKLYAKNSYHNSLLQAPPKKEEELAAAYAWQGEQIAWELPDASQT